MIKERFGEVDTFVYRLFPFVRSLRMAPDALTLAGAGVSLLAGAAFAGNHWFLAGLLLMVAGFCDMVDGVVARQQGISSQAGAFFDSSIDRLSDLVVFGGIAVARAKEADVFGTVLVMWAITASVMTSYTRASAERQLASLKVGFMERAERCLVLIVGALTSLVMTAVFVIAVGATYTSLQRILEGRRLLRVLEETGVDPTRTPETAHGQ
ncbi:MAG TPA: CDP-alcohol phosphatidyltransferase family protein [Myxococcota bacterium]|nr:CDP-alcohol phosphatidyltransferase family protein [Myxococcota bacterium]